MSEEKKINDQQESGSPEQLSLNDDRRVKVLSPGTLVAKRFFRNRLAVVGLTILAVMFIFSFIGGLISPYGQDEVFYRDDIQLKEYAAMSENTEYRYLVADGQEFGTILQAQLTLHMGKDDSFSYKGVTYDVTEEGDSLYSVSSGGRLLIRTSSARTTPARSSASTSASTPSRRTPTAKRSLRPTAKPIRLMKTASC